MANKKKDPERMPRMLALIAELWAKHPEQRLGQLFFNYAWLGSKEDSFYIEDDILIERLQRALE